jgi:mRNA interferase MazF
MAKPRRGELWTVNLDPTLAREETGSRPALVISVDELNQSAADLVIVLPVTTREKNIRSHVAVDRGEGGLRSRSFVKCEDIRSISIRRLRRRLGSVPPETLAAVEDRLRILLGIY